MPRSSVVVYALPRLEVVHQEQVVAGLLTMQGECDHVFQRYSLRAETTHFLHRKATLAQRIELGDFPLFVIHQAEKVLPGWPGAEHAPLTTRGNRVVVPLHEHAVVVYDLDKLNRTSIVISVADVTAGRCGSTYAVNTEDGMAVLDLDRADLQAVTYLMLQFIRYITPDILLCAEAGAEVLVSLLGFTTPQDVQWAPWVDWVGDPLCWVEAYDRLYAGSGKDVFFLEY